MATITDVAKLAGVSTATVSRSFAASHALNQHTRQRVLEVADRLNYRPRRAAVSAGPSVKRSRGPLNSTIGFQFFAYNSADTLSANAFYGPVLASAQAEADALGMNLLLHTTYRHKLTQELPQMIREQAVAGMLLVGTADPAILQSFLQYVPQIVLVDNRDVTSQHDCIYSDGFGGAMEATNYLMGLGHRHIGFLTSRVAEVTLQDRLNGYFCAHLNAGLAIDKKSVLEAGASEDVDESCISIDEIITFLKRPDRPTAFVAANDTHAVILLHACRRLGISVPEEMSIIGYDDIEISAHVYPALTTLRVNKDHMGRLAVRRLYRRLQPADEGVEPEPSVRMELPVSLVLRESCAPCRP